MGAEKKYHDSEVVVSDSVPISKLSARAIPILSNDFNLSCERSQVNSQNPPPAPFPFVKKFHV